MAWTKKTVIVRAEYYERLRREAFYNRQEIKFYLDMALELWIAANPEKVRGEAVPLEESRPGWEIDQIKIAMRAADNSRAKAAGLLGISRMSLYNKIQRYGLQFPHSRKPSHK